MADRINRELPRDGRVLLLAGLHGFFIDREVIFDTQQVMPPVALRLSRGCGTPSVLRRRFRRLGIRYVLHTPQLEAFERECRCLASREPDGNCLGEFWRRYAEPMFSVGELTLYRLRGEAEAAARPPPVRLAWPAVEEVAFVEADTLHLAGDLRGAERALAALARRDPALTSVRLRLASLYQATGRWEEAERHLERARRSGEDRAAYWLLLARALARRDEREGAYEAARRGVERWPSPRAYVSLAVHALNTGRVREAEEAAERARLLDPADRGVRRIVARLL